jgi:putative hydroxymethylpyrimidine transport system substrate-binding protein
LFLLALPLQAQEKHRLILDWFPNADHVPLYVARDAGFFAKAGLDIELIAPADPNDPLKLVAAGQADFAINYQPNVIIARAEGLPVRGVGVLVEHPLSSLAFLKRSGIRAPADLKGKRIGYSVEGIELALLRALGGTVGLKPGDYSVVNVNFNLTSSLLSGQVDAVMGAFWNYELAELELEGVPGSYFALEQHGIPDYYELIVISNDRFDTAHPDTARRLITALQQAIDFCRTQPEQALALYFKANPEVRKDLDERAFRATLPVFAKSQTQSRETWTRFAEFALKSGMIAKPVPVETLYRNP